MIAHLPEKVTEALSAARSSERGRFAELLLHDSELRQSIVALTEGTMLPEHNSPPAASIQVLQGSIRAELDGEVQGELGDGDLWVLTHQRHEVRALTDAVFLLTTVTGVDRDSHD